MRSDFKEDELALYIGGRILTDADKLRLFMPDCFARFPIEWDGYNYEIHIYPRGRADDVQQ